MAEDSGRNMTRHELRTCVFLLLYQMDFYPDDMYEEQQDIFLNEVKKEDPLTAEEQEFVEGIVASVKEHLPEIDRKIEGASKGWKLKRIAKAELAILRLGVYEALYDDEVPAKIAINEAVELAKDYGRDKGYAFVNGVLDTICKEADVDEGTAEYGLIGGKLGHSYSKEIHERLADYTYELIPLSEKEFADFMDRRDFKAINVTIPYKQKVIPYLASMDERASAIGAVNTIVNRDGSLYGYNTDYPGFSYMLKKNGISVSGKKLLIIGNGGAAQAVKACVRDEGAGELVLVRRSEDDECVSYDEVYEKHTDADIIINTSPVGMYPDTEASPIDLTSFNKCEAVVDLIYNPISTKLVLQARELGIKGITGLEMLVAQAKYAVEIFLDKEIDDGVIDDIYSDMMKESEKN